MRVFVIQFRFSDTDLKLKQGLYQLGSMKSSNDVAGSACRRLRRLRDIQESCPLIEPSLPQLSPVPPSSDVAGSSRRTRTASTDFTYSRQSKRLRDVRGLCPLQEQSLQQVNPATSSSDVAGSSRRASDRATKFTFSRQSKCRRDIQEVPSLGKRSLCRQVCPAIGEHHIPTTMTTLPPSNDCTKCGAIKLAFETLTFFCSNDQVHIVQNELPPELLDLYGGIDDNALYFQTYARMYNNTFAFSSLGGSAHADTQKEKTTEHVYFLKYKLKLCPFL